MKKTIALILSAVCLLTLFAGCSANKGFDPADESRLFHTSDVQTPVYQAPCLDCGIIGLLPAGTTVRVTGLLPQADWVQVMTPLGKVVFIKTQDIKKGRGSLPLPYHSKITPAP